MNKPVLSAIAAIAFAAAAAFAAACGGGDDDSPLPTAVPPTQVASTAPAGATTTPGQPTVAPTSTSTTAANVTVTTGDDTVNAGAAGLVDSGGFSLYIFASDVADSGKSACVAGCSSAWPPLIVDGTPTAGPGVTGELATITRLDGSLQVTYNGKPLYRWINDVNPGDTTGTAINNWSLAQP